MRKYRGIKKAAGETKYLDGWNGRVQINYDPSDKTVGNVWYLPYQTMIVRKKVSLCFPFIFYPEILFSHVC